MASPDDSDTDDSDTAALTAVLAELYAVAPDEFVATRTRLAQEAKARGEAALAKEVGRLRRPTVSAWAVNQVVRERPDQVERLRDVGRGLRAAQGQLDAAAMRDLRPERDRLLEDWAGATTEVTAAAGRPLAAAALDEVRGTVIAALAWEDATDAVASGHLTRALSYSGFGEVDLSEAVVRTSSGVVLTVVPGSTRAKPRTEKGSSTEKPEVPAKAAPRHTGGKRSGEQGGPATARGAEDQATGAEEKTAEREAAARAAAERQQRVDAAREAHSAAQEAAHEARLALDQARDRADETRWRVEDLEEQLKGARQEHRDAEQAATAAARARRAADVDVAKAERAVRDAEAAR